MKNSLYLSAACCLAAALALAPWALGRPEPAAPDKPADKASDKAGPDAEAPPGLDTADLNDPAFGHFTDLALAGRAWASQDPALLTDVALQLAEGERVLARNHKCGLTAKQLLGLAAKLAADKKDKGTLERLARAADARGDKNLAAQVGAARKLADEARAVDPALLLSVETTTPEEFTAFRAYLRDIRAARLTNDSATLEAIAQELPHANGLPPERLDYLRNLLKEAHDSPQAADPEAAKLARTLDKLALASRGPFDVIQQAVNDTSGDLADWDKHRLGWGHPHETYSTFDDPVAPPPAPIHVNFAVNNRCPSNVRVQFFPGGQTFTFPPKRVTNCTRVSYTGQVPYVVVLSSGESHTLANANFQIYKGNDNLAHWAEQ